MKMEKETLKQIRTKIGIRRYLVMLPSINRAEQQKPKLAFHITDDKKTLEQKKYIEKKINNLKIMNPMQWQIYVYKKLTPEQQKKAKKKIEKIIEKQRKKGRLNESDIPTL